MKNNTLSALCLAFLITGLTTSAQAQEWTFEPIVKVGGEYDDNATLDIRTDEEVSLSGLLVDVQADLEYSSPTTSFAFRPRATIRDFSDEPDFDSEDLFLRANFERKSRSSTFGFRAFYDDQAIRTGERANSEFDVEDPDDLTDDDTGRVIRFGSRSKWRMRPSWWYRLSEISTIGANLDYYDVQYDDAVADTLNDYSDARLNLNYQRKFSNVNTALLTATSRRYDPDGASGDVTGYGLMGGFEYALSETTKIRTMLGIEDTNQTGFDYDPELVANVVLTRNLETIRIFAQYRRSVNASGAGRLTSRDSFNLNFRRRLSEKISAGLGVRAYQTKGIAGTTSVDDRNYVQLRSSFLWYLTSTFVVEADYRYTVIDREFELGERANSNQVNVWFVYQPRTSPTL